MFRFLTGAGIGGEYAAINSTIQELIPARFRGWTDLVINGSFWIGAALGAGGSIVLARSGRCRPGVRLAARLPHRRGAWRCVILVMRLWIPESPRWLMTHGCIAEADAIVAGIEAASSGAASAEAPGPAEACGCARATTRRSREVARRLFHTYRQRTLGRPGADGGAGVLLQRDLLHLRAGADRLLRRRRRPTSAGTSCPSPPAMFSGPVLLGRLFDIVGRRPMIASTYVMSGLLLAVSGYLFARRSRRPHADVAWTIVFFFASAAASSAYLTVGETFPLEIRAFAIAVLLRHRHRRRRRGGPSAVRRLIGTRLARSVAIGCFFGCGADDRAAAVGRAGASPPNASRSRKSAGRYHTSSHNRAGLLHRKLRWCSPDWPR